MNRNGEWCLSLIAKILNQINNYFILLIFSTLPGNPTGDIT